MRTRLQAVIVALGTLFGALSQPGCEYYGTHSRGATYFGYPEYYYAGAFRPQPNIYVPPATAVGGGPAATPTVHK